MFRVLRRGAVRRNWAPFVIGAVFGALVASVSSPTRDGWLFDWRPSYDLVILITSSVGYTDRRHTIRDTWLTQRPGNVKALFLVGKQRVEPGVLAAADYEGRDHGDDVLMVDTRDDFDSLTAKIVAGFRAVLDKYRTKFVLKVDDDSFVNLPELMKALESKPEQRLYWGYFTGRANVKSGGKYEEGGWFLCDRYLPYARGGGYLLSSDLVQYLVDSAPRSRAYRAEDVTFGTWLAPLEILRHHDVRFDTEYRSRGCSHDFLITHKKSPLSMEELHANLKASNGEKLCTQEVVHARPYVYNWDVLPSKCCELR